MKVVIITGAAKGIGRAITEKLARKGMHVIANYKTSKKEAEELQENLKKEGYSIDIFKADVSKRNEIENLINFTIQKYKKIDILINNAGIDQYKLFTDITNEDWSNMINNNLNSVFYMSQEAVKYMLKEHSGCIINISSIWGITGGACEVHYSVTKAAIDGMTKALAKELAPSGIRVNSIAPGMIMTDMNNKFNEQELKEIIKEIPLERIGRPEDIAKCVDWIVEDEYTTGQIISPNGGWVI